MRSTSVFTTCLLLAALAGCSSTDQTVTTQDSTTAPPAVDLTDASTQTALGSPPPDGIVWERLAGVAIIVGQTTAAIPTEIDQIGVALSDIPAGLLAVAEPRHIVRVPDIGGAEAVAGAVTVTYGPDIYLLDRTFADGDRTTSRIDLTFALAHELAHVGQWFALDDSYVSRALAGQVPSVQLAAGSSAVRQWAAAVGWVDTSTDPDQPDWRLDRGVAPTAYGATSPVEDLADTIALTAIGRANWLDEERLTWVTTRLSASTEQLSAGMPWVPFGAEEVRSPTPLFDEDLANHLAAEQEAGHIEPASFVLLDPDLEQVATEVEEQLRRRGLTGTLGSVGGSTSPRLEGTFARDDGTTFLVELWDLTDIGDENEVVLTYVHIW